MPFSPLQTVEAGFLQVPVCYILPTVAQASDMLHLCLTISLAWDMQVCADMLCVVWHGPETPPVVWHGTEESTLVKCAGVS